MNWSKLSRRLLTAICAVGAVAASFIFLTDLARQNGWPWYAAPLLPLCIDALGGMALLQYREGRPNAGKVAIGAIAASFAGNAFSHLFATGVMHPGWVSIALIGGIPALSLGLCVHLNTGRATDAPAPGESVRSDTGDPARAPADGGGVRVAVRGGGQAGKPGAAVSAAAAKAPRVRADRGAPTLHEQRARAIVDHGWQDLKLDELMDADHLDSGYVQASNARKLARELLAAVPNGNVTLVE